MYSRSIHFSDFFRQQDPKYQCQLDRLYAENGLLPVKMKPLNRQQAAKFREAIRDHPLEALFYLAVSKGIREGELFGLMWPDVEWDLPAIHIQRQAQRVRGQGILFKAPKTKNALRMLFLCDEEIRLLRVHQSRQEETKTRRATQGLWQEHNLIFPSNAGTPLDPSNLTRRFKQVLKKSGLPEVRFHDLRRNLVTRL